VLPPSYQLKQVLLINLVPITTPAWRNAGVKLYHMTKSQKYLYTKESPISLGSFFLKALLIFFIAIGIIIYINHLCDAAIKHEQKNNNQQLAR